MSFKIHKRARMNYWSCAEWVSKFQKEPKITIIHNEDELTTYFNKKTPLIEIIIDKIQDTVMFPGDFIYSVKCYFNNLKSSTHVLSGSLERGQWCDLDYRIGHCLFSELEKFILKEKGLETHEWEKTLVKDEDWGLSKEDPSYGQPTEQALAAVEQEVIWNWWKANKDYHDRDFVSLEEDDKYKEQETEMLIRLIKIRGSLWS